MKRYLVVIKVTVEDSHCTEIGRGYIPVNEQTISFASRDFKLVREAKAWADKIVKTLLTIQDLVNKV